MTSSKFKPFKSKSKSEPRSRPIHTRNSYGGNVVSCSYPLRTQIPSLKLLPLFDSTPFLIKELKILFANQQVPDQTHTNTKG